MQNRSAPQQNMSKAYHMLIYLELQFPFEAYASNTHSLCRMVEHDSELREVHFNPFCPRSEHRWWFVENAWDFYIQECNKTKHQKIQWVYSFLQTSTSKKQTIEGPVAGSPLSRYGINLSPRASARWIFFVPGRDLLVVGVWSFRPPLKVEDRLIEVGIRGKESWFKETCNRT